MARRIVQPNAGGRDDAPEPEAIDYLTSAIAALPPDRADWYRENDRGNVVPIPQAMSLMGLLGGTAWIELGRTWPDREKFLRWLLDPHGSPAGADYPPMPEGITVQRPYLHPTHYPHVWKHINQAQRRKP